VAWRVRSGCLRGNSFTSRSQTETKEVPAGRGGGGAQTSCSSGMRGQRAEPRRAENVG
jgi:hypothetical protein